MRVALLLSLWTACLAALGCSGAGNSTGAGGGPPAARDALGPLQGTWRGVGGEENGKALTPDDAKAEEEEFVFRDDTLTVRKHGKVKAVFQVALDPSKDPKELDLRFAEGEHKGKDCLAIYALDGDRLQICTNTKLRPGNGEPRPNVFSTQKSDEPSRRPGKLLFIMERQK